MRAELDANLPLGGARLGRLGSLALLEPVVLCRELTTGVLTWESGVSVVSLVLMGLLGMAVVRRRLDTLLLT